MALRVEEIARTKPGRYGLAALGLVLALGGALWATGMLTSAQGGAGDADDWELIGEGAGGAHQKFYIDPKSIKRSGDVVTVREQQSPLGNGTPGAAVGTYEFNCATRTSREIASEGGARSERSRHSRMGQGDRPDLARYAGLRQRGGL